LPDVQSPDAPAAERVSYVLYFNFGQLQQDGRARAVDAGKRWVRDVMGPEDRAMVAAYASLPGLRELSPFTSDKQQILDAIDRGYEDPDFVDPFPSLFYLRLKECEDCCETYPFPCMACGEDCCGPVCKGNARDEYQHGRRSLKTLIAFLGRLEGIPGRKSMLMFHQNESIYPTRLYPGGEAGDHVALLDSAGAEATLSRTVVHPAYSGSLNRLESELAGQAVSFGANLADFTGGSYNRGNTDLTAMMDATVKDCACTYRIGIRPPREYKNRVFRIKVWAQGRPVPYRYRTLFLDELDRWWRRAQGVLANPGVAQDVILGAALVPVGESDGGWDLSVRIGLDVDSLALFPTAGKQRGDWEVGALLHREEGGLKREMLGRSKLLIESAIDPDTVVLHQRTFAGLKPGAYKLAAFVRDRAASAFGGAEATLVLPRKANDGIVGPVLLMEKRRVLRTELPLLKERSIEPTRNKTVQAATVPSANALIPRGASLDLVTWVCEKDDPLSVTEPLRFVSMNGTPLFRFEQSEEPATERCREFADRVETDPLEPGTYSYHVRWNRAEGEEVPREETLTFEVVPPAWLAGAPEASPR
jgi:hypothetical protein